jgi:type I restriction enzyme S subunit
VKTLFAVAKGIEDHVRRATVLTEHLPQAILARAFRGELVPTEAELAAEEGRDYEPASELLERIQESRKHNKPAKRGRRGNARVSVSQIADVQPALSLSDKGA